MEFKCLAIHCLEVITRNLYKLYLICLNHSMKIPYMIGQQIYDYSDERMLKEEDFLFFSREICSFLKLRITEKLLKSFVNRKMKIGIVKDIRFENCYFMTKKHIKCRDDWMRGLIIKEERKKEKGFTLLCKNLLQLRNSIEYLDLRSCTFNNKQKKSLFILLKECRNLKTIFLNGNSRIVNGKLFQILKSKRKLINFHLKNYSEANCSNDLANFVLEHPYMSYLNLAGNRLLSNFFHHLVTKMKPEIRGFLIEKLNLSCIQISHYSSFFLEKFLIMCKNLKLITLAFNPDLNFPTIFKSMEICQKSLRVIDLERCELSTADFQHFLNLLPKLTRISHLNLSGNYCLTRKNFKNLHDIIKSLKTVQLVCIQRSSMIHHLVDKANSEFKNKRLYWYRLSIDQWKNLFEIL